MTTAAEYKAKKEKEARENLRVSKLIEIGKAAHEIMNSIALNKSIKD